MTKPQHPDLSPTQRKRLAGKKAQAKATGASALRFLCPPTMSTTKSASSGSERSKKSDNASFMGGDSRPDGNDNESYA